MSPRSHAGLGCALALALAPMQQAAAQVVVLQSLSPTTGSANGGTTVTLVGSGFAAGAVVAFGLVPARSVTVQSDVQITAVTPAEPAATVDVTVTNLDGHFDKLVGAFTFAVGGGGTGGGLSNSGRGAPGGPPGAGPNSGCGTAGSELALLGLVPLALRRRRGRRRC